MTRVRIVDLREAGVCPRARLWFERHGLDWRGFVRDGIDAETLRATGDQLELIERVVAVAERREAAGG